MSCCSKGIQNPFGGAASGLWPAGFQAPQETPTLTSTCIGANLLSDCFAACTGEISALDVGPMCGWSWFSGFGDFGGSVAFSPGQMAMKGSEFQQPSAARPFNMALPKISGTTFQFTFTEYQTPPGTGENYFVFVRTVDGKEGLAFVLDDFGDVIIQAGPVDNAPSYTGTWTPNGGTHKVQIVIDDSGVPIVYIDGVQVSLGVPVFAPSQASSLDPNTIVLSWFVSDPSPQVISSPVFSVFASRNVLPASAVFCCP